MPFIPHTDQDVKKMLDVIGIEKIDDLFDEIPSHLLCRPLTGVPEGRTEMEMLRLMSERAEADSGALSFIGAGAYEHHIPAAVWDITTRGEFMTAYTPYQAEASQGTLQLIYEYQSMMCALTGLDASNASLYDGGSGLGEAILMAVRANRKSKSKKVLLAGSVHPLYVKAAETLVKNQGIEIELVDFDSSTMCLETASLKERNGQDFAALVIAQPNFFGALEQVDAMTNWAHEQNALVIGIVNPTSLALLVPPGQWGEQGADIAIGEGQPLGIPLASGGPYFGFICCKQKLVRQMPGRIIGRTVDLEGKDGYTLTLQAREQHIRRSKATSNICTNQGLAVTAATIYMSMLGFDGLRRVATACHANTVKLQEMLSQIPGVEVKSVPGFFHEIVIETPLQAEELLAKLADLDVLGGYALGRHFEGLDNAILICATEVKTDADLMHYQQALKSVLVEEAA